MKHTFEADDGTKFATHKECKEHDDHLALQITLSNLESDQIAAAFDGDDPKLADAFERAGIISASRRRERGHLKRVIKNKEAALDTF